MFTVDTLQRPPRTLKGSIALGQPNSLFDRPVILFNHVIEISWIRRGIRDRYSDLDRPIGAGKRAGDVMQATRRRGIKRTPLAKSPDNPATSPTARPAQS